MQIKSFKSYLDNRLDKKEIKVIEQAAQMELESLKMLQCDVSNAVSQYVSDNGLGFNELVRRLGKSPTQVSKIIKGNANLTMATIAQLYALMGRRVHIVTEK